MDQTIGKTADWAGIGAPIIFALVCWLACQTCYGQWGQFTQPDLRQFTEKAIRNRTVVVNPPEILITPGPKPGSRGLLINFGDYAPKDLSSDTLFDRVLGEQFRVTMIRTYRNRPDMIRWWAPTLRAVERKIQDQLNIIANDSLTPDQKDLAIQEIDLQISGIYDALFQEWARRDGLGGYRTVAAAKGYEIKLIAVPSAVISFMPMARQDLYLYATQVKKLTNVSPPEWDTPQSSPVYVAGQFWWHARFRESKRHVMEHRTINRKGSLIFTPDGIDQR